MRWTPPATVVGDRDEGAVREHDPLGEAAGRRRRAECQARHTAQKRARAGDDEARQIRRREVGPRHHHRRAWPPAPYV